MISKESLYDDMRSVDLKEAIILLKKSDPLINIAEGTFQPKSSDEFYIPECLFRQASSRTSGVIRQIFTRGVSIANAHVDTVDAVVEIWNNKELNLRLRINDIIRRLEDGMEYEIIAFDEATGRTRFRCAVRRVH